MQSDDAILQRVRKALACCRRPRHFIDCTHRKQCDECAQHDELLSSRDIYSLRIEDVGNSGWDPICVISPEGFAYYLPALARLALAEPDRTYGWYGKQFLWHLCYRERDQNSPWLACTPKQRIAIVELLQYIAETRASLVDKFFCVDEMFRAIEIWSDKPLKSKAP